MTATSITTQLKTVAAQLNNRQKARDLIARQNPFLQFNEMLIADLEHKIGKDATCTLLYVHDLCKKGLYNSLQGGSSKAAQCFSKIEQLAVSLKKPDSELVSVMSYPLMANFLVTKGQLETASSLVTQTFDAYQALGLGRHNLACYLYPGNVQILYSRMLIRKGDASQAIDRLFATCRKHLDAFADPENDEHAREFAAAAVIGMLVELTKFALRNHAVDGLYTQFLDTISSEAVFQADKTGPNGELLTKYLRINKLRTGMDMELLLSEFIGFLQLETDEHKMILTAWLVQGITQRLSDAGYDFIA
jgi:hypothetical protein